MKIALIGYGKMGRQIKEIAETRGHEIVSIIDIDNPEDYNTDAFRSAEVAIEFTTPQTAYANYLKAFEQGVKVVSGSTGWKDEHEADMRKLCEQEGKTLFWASNFSVGVALFNAVNTYFARLMNRFPEYDVRMSETHHIHKLDAPSGTAITLAESLIANLDRKTKDTLHIESIRKDEVPGIHSIIYDSEADSITLTHDAHSRKGFALGAVLAAEFTATHHGLLTMDDLFSFQTL